MSFTANIPVAVKLKNVSPKKASSKRVSQDSLLLSASVLVLPGEPVDARESLRKKVKKLKKLPPQTLFFQKQGRDP